MFRSHLPIAITAALFALASTAATAAPPIAIQTKATDAAASGFYRMPLGKFTVIALADGNFDMPAPTLLSEDKPGIVKRLLGTAGSTDTVPTSTHGFLIDTRTKPHLIQPPPRRPPT